MVQSKECRSPQSEASGGLQGDRPSIPSEQALWGKDVTLSSGLTLCRNPAHPAVVFQATLFFFHPFKIRKGSSSSKQMAFMKLVEALRSHSLSWSTGTILVPLSSFLRNNQTFNSYWLNFKQLEQPPLPWSLNNMQRNVGLLKALHIGQPTTCNVREGWISTGKQHLSAAIVRLLFASSVPFFFPASSTVLHPTLSLFL